MFCRKHARGGEGETQWNISSFCSVVSLSLKGFSAQILKISHLYQLSCQANSLQGIFDLLLLKAAKCTFRKTDHRSCLELGWPAKFPYELSILLLIEKILSLKSSMSLLVGGGGRNHIFSQYLTTPVHQNH